jgi:hypothetical protein
MYAPRIIQAKLQKFRGKAGWDPVYHSIADIQNFNEYLERITSNNENSRNGYISVNKRISRDAYNEIKRFIENEQVLCSVDSNYFETRYAYICNAEGDIYKFENRKSQEVFDSVVAHFEDLEVAIELFILKARQLGISTKTALKFVHRMLFIPHTQAVMSSVIAEKSELIGRIINICYDKLPFWLPPRITTERVGKMIEYDNGSILSMQSGNQATGIAQGWTPTCIHISEVGDIPNPKKTIEEGLLRATHSTRKLFQVFEGTGNGNTGWQADYWRTIKEDFPRGMARLCPVFINWPLATDLYPPADWLKKFPIPENWYPCEDTRKHVSKCELYIRSNTYLSKVCGDNWSMPRPQQWFWEFNFLSAVKTKTQKVWMSQMPADDMEALTGKNDLVFDPEVIRVVSQDRKLDYRCYAIVGNSIDDGFEPNPIDVDYDEPRIEIEWDSNRGNHYEWMLIPLKPFNELVERDSLDKLLVFEDPIMGRDYSMGIDTADGLGKDDEDRSCFNLTRSAKGNMPDVQVCEFASNRINPPQLVGFAGAVCAWFHPYCADERGVKLCIEQRMRPGDDCQLQLKFMGFTFHHVMTRYDGKKVKENMGQKEGWYTNEWSRPFITNRFVDAVTNGWYKPNSKFLLAELADFERTISARGKSRMDHQSGKHDDRIWAAAQAYITRHHLDVLSERSKTKYLPKTGVLPTVSREFPRLGNVSVGD